MREVLCGSSKRKITSQPSIYASVVRGRTLGVPLTSGCFSPLPSSLRTIHRTKADDGLNSRPPLLTEARKHQLSLLRSNYSKLTSPHYSLFLQRPRRASMDCNVLAVSVALPPPRCSSRNFLASALASFRAA